jgi:hypothetical protein
MDGGPIGCLRTSNRPYTAAMAGETSRPTVKKDAPGTIGALIASYKASGQYTALSDTSKDGYARSPALKQAMTWSALARAVGLRPMYFPAAFALAIWPRSGAQLTYPLKCVIGSAKEALQGRYLGRASTCMSSY